MNDNVNLPQNYDQNNQQQAVINNNNPSPKKITHLLKFWPL